MTLRGKVIFITGASRGIGKAIALRCARDGARVAIAAKTEKAHPKAQRYSFRKTNFFSCQGRFIRRPKKLKQPAAKPFRSFATFAMKNKFNVRLI